MLKIFVTGDNHIGMKYANYTEREALIDARISAFEAMVEKANQERCDLFVITGDLFETNKKIAQKDVRRVIEYLAQFQGNVAVLPGNHDFYEEAPDDPKNNVWRNFTETAEKLDNIHLLNEYREYELSVGDDTVILYPALCQTKHSAENMLGWIKEADIQKDGAYHIGIAHGAVEGETIDKEGRYYPMTRKELEAIPVDAWLIGHTHVPFPDNLTEEFAPSEKILNAGTHVQTDVSCNTEGLCFIVEIDEQKNVRAKKFVSGNVHFERKPIHLTAGEMESILQRELKAIADNTVVDIVLSGAVTPEEYKNRAEVMHKYLARFIEYKWGDSELSKLITKDLIEAEYPETSFAAQLLTALLEEPKEAQLVYEMMNALAKEGK